MRVALVLASMMVSSLLLACTDQESEKRVQAAEERAVAAEKRANLAEEKLLKMEKQPANDAERQAKREKIYESRYEKSDDVDWSKKLFNNN